MTRHHTPLKVLLIGFGAMGQFVHERLASDPAFDSWHVLVRPGRVESTQALLGDRGRAVDSLDDVESDIDLAIECAGHAALDDIVPRLLASGVDTVVASVGALAMQGRAEALEAACVTGGGRLTLVPGALAGIDALSAARPFGLESVVYTGRKPPVGWRGTAAEGLCDLAGLQIATNFFIGTARQAAIAFPKNANVAAIVALAGLGLDDTTVNLIADPHVGANTHTVTALGAFGRLDVTVEARPLRANPKTSALAGMSIVHAVRRRLDAFVI